MTRDTRLAMSWRLSATRNDQPVRAYPSQRFDETIAGDAAWIGAAMGRWPLNVWLLDSLRRWVSPAHRRQSLRRFIAFSALSAAMAFPALAGAERQPRDLTPVISMKAPAHPPVELVRKGRARAVVYVADRNPSATLKRLAAEMVEVIRLSTGATLERVAQLPPADRPAIVIGDCGETRKAGIDAA